MLGYQDGPMTQYRLWDQNRRAGRVARVQRLMRLARFGKLEALMDGNLDSARRDDGEEIVRRFLQLLGVARVAHQGGARQIKRALGAQDAGLEDRKSTRLNSSH